jgi:23S rRNA pseudouridine1911/1915/1917 synthase
MVVHPAVGNYTGTRVNALKYHCKDSLSGINGVIRPGIVHRIDKYTSGLLVAAKNDKAHINLAEQIKNHTLERKYHAVITGVLKESSGTINVSIGRHKTDRKKMAVVAGGREAITHYKVLEIYGNKYSYIEAQLETGRTHQIRVHFAYINHPLLGDNVYGTESKLIFGQCLHAKSLQIVHPVTGEKMLFDSDIPAYFSDVLDKIGRY